MARRTLSVRGRIVAAGVSVAAASSLTGIMAARDHTADASTSSTPAATSSPTATSSTPGAAATPSDGQSAPGDVGVQPQPQTRTGGS